MTARILLTALLLTSTTRFGQTSTKPSNPTTSAKKTGPKLYDITVEQLRCPKAVTSVPKAPFVAPCQLKTLPPWKEGWVHLSRPGKRRAKWKLLLQQCLRVTHPGLSSCEALVSHQGPQPKLLKTRRRTQRRLDHIKVTRGGPRIRPGKIVYKGSLSRETIQRTVKGSLSSIRRCYEAELQKQPGLRGKLVVAWTIGPLGRVTAASASQNTVGSVDVERCVVRVVRAMEFVPPKNGRDVVVHYPFVFDVSMFARDIDDEVRRWDKQTSACWKHAPTKKAADVDLFWTLKNDGSVSSVRRTKAGNLKVSACLADVVRNMKFGAVPAAEGIEVAYTFQRRGSLSRKEIQKVIRQHLSSIRDCYEVELNRTPGLQGKVVSKFTIEPDGSVGANEVAAVSMHNNAVETCIASIVGGMQFPKPKGGGSVIVHYPFIFDAQ